MKSATAAQARTVSKTVAKETFKALYQRAAKVRTLHEWQKIDQQIDRHFNNGTLHAPHYLKLQDFLCDLRAAL